MTGKSITLNNGKTFDYTAQQMRQEVEARLGPPKRGKATNGWLCPFHDETDPSFGLTPDGLHFHCFGCEAHGDLIDFVAMLDGCNFLEAIKRLGMNPPEDEAQRQIWELQREQRRARWELEQVKRQQEEHERRLTALEQMAKLMPLVEEYHGNLWDSEEARTYWEGEGIDYDSIRRWQLGYCRRCPLAPSPSHTIPVINGGKLRDIRHRLTKDVGGGKYRPHMSGLATTLFNADELKSAPRYIIVAEGEKKVIQLSQQGFSAVGIFGKSGFDDSWAKYFRQQRIYVCLDPDAVDQAAKIAALFNGRGYVVELPTKADDFFVQAGGTRKDFQSYLNWARRP